MALRWADKTVEESTSTTTGAYQLGGVPSGAAAGSQTFVAGIGDGNTCYYEAEEVGGSAYERGIGTVADATPDTLTRTTIHASSNGGSAVDWTGKTVRVMCVMPAYAVRRAMLDHAGLLENITLATSRSGNAETIAVKTLAGTDPSVTDPVRVGFAKTDGTFEVLELTAALSLTISSGSTLGAVSGAEFKVAVVLINDAGTLRLGAMGRPSGIRDNSVVSSTAEGGAGAADTARTIYTGTAVTSKRARVLGYLTYTLGTAGTWDTAPSDILLTRAGATEIYAPEVLYDVTLGSSGAFDTNDVWPAGLPTGYERFEIDCCLRSTVSATFDAEYLLFNGDTTVTNYRSVAVFGSGSTAGQDATDAPVMGNPTGATSPANSFENTNILINNPNGTTRNKNAVAKSSGQWTSGTGSNSFVSQVRTMTWKSTAAIIRIQLRTDNHPTDLLVAGSSMRLIGYRPMTVLQ